MPDIHEMFRGKPDGSFLVCGSRKDGKYILIVRKGKNNEMIHISHCGGKYGFFDSYPPRPIHVDYPTIPALVEHFSRVPLTEYKAHLNITLAHPISRFTEVYG